MDASHAQEEPILIAKHVKTTQIMEPSMFITNIKQTIGVVYSAKLDTLGTI